jgi:hypothetical protein
VGPTPIPIFSSPCYLTPPPRPSHWPPPTTGALASFWPPSSPHGLLRGGTQTRTTSEVATTWRPCSASPVGSTTWVRAAVEPAPLSSISPHAGGRGMPFLSRFAPPSSVSPHTGGRGMPPFLPSSAPPSSVSPYGGGCSTSFLPSSAPTKSSNTSSPRRRPQTILLRRPRTTPTASPATIFSLSSLSYVDML